MNKYDIYDYEFEYEESRLNTSPDKIIKSKVRPCLVLGNDLFVPIVKITHTNRPSSYKIVDYESAGVDSNSYIEFSQKILVSKNKAINYRGHLSDTDIQNIKQNHLDESVEKHDTLNQKIFNGNELDPEVKDKLLEIVDNFKNALEQDDIKLDIKDVRIIGSNASYNYTDKSDIDLHIFADLSVYQGQEDLAEKVYMAYKSLWNNKFDPIVRGHEVEIYVEPWEE